MSLSALLIVLAAAEIGLMLMVRHMRSGFQWLITEADEQPSLDSRALRKFLDSSFDPRLGWVRRPHSIGVEKGQRDNITFHIDSQGARSTPDTGNSPVVAAFGDSYVFCRQVEDSETWEAELSRLTGVGVANFGVGNYGADQALLRYEGTALPDTVKVAVLGFVPETVCRVQSCWKHYLEFGNTFAFKPRFVLDPSGQLTLIPNPMQDARDFDRLPEILPQVRKIDGFYRRRFRALQFRFPYLASFARHPLRHGRLIAALALRALLRLLHAADPRIEQRPFTLVMLHNIREAHRMYEDDEATRLLSAILLRFNEQARARGHVPLVLVMPQLLDLKLGTDGSAPYRGYFETLGKQMPILDLTGTLNAHASQGLYVEDQYGGHLSPKGNRVVAEKVAAWLLESNALQRAERGSRQCG
jgi:hypothetical protein